MAHQGGPRHDISGSPADRAPNASAAWPARRLGEPRGTFQPSTVAVFRHGGLPVPARGRRRALPPERL